MSEGAIPPVVSPQRSAMRPQPSEGNVFLHGPNGLRAGWRALIFILVGVGIGLAILVCLGIVLAVVLAATGRAEPAWLNPDRVRALQVAPPPTAVLFVEALTFGWLLIVTWTVGRIEDRPLSQFGLPLRAPHLKSVWSGLLWGFLSISGVMMTMLLFHGVRITGIETHGSALAVASVEWGAAFLALGLAEEFMFRGYLQFTLTTGIGFWPAAFALSVLFGLVHMSNPGETPLGLIQIGEFGLLACLALRRTGTLWWPIGFHAAWNWGQTFFYGVPDSGLNASRNFLRAELVGPSWLTGGTTGPEASVLTLIVFAVVALLLTRRYREVRYPLLRSA